MTPTLSSLWGTGCYDVNFVITGGTGCYDANFIITGGTGYYDANSVNTPDPVPPVITTELAPLQLSIFSVNASASFVITAVRQRRNLIVVPAFRCSTVVTNVHSGLSTVQCQAIA